MVSSAGGPIRDGFTIVRRGYAPDEVAEVLDGLQRQVHAADAARADAEREVADLSLGLTTAQAEITAARADVDALHDELNRQATEPLTMSALSARMQRLLKITEDEATEIRTAADKYRTETTAAADADAEGLRTSAATDAEQLHSEADTEVTALRAEAATEIARLQSEMADERAELDQLRTAAYAQAKKLVSDAHADAEAMVTEARERALHLTSAAAADRAKQDEDYGLAIDARRRQAHRAIIEAEQAAQADAAHRIDQANTHARTVVESANAHAEDLLRRAASESHQRVAEADDAVRKLVTIRAELQQQILDLTGRLAELSDTMADIRKTLEPLPLEAQRPSLDAFPADAQVSPAATRGAEPPQWHPPAPPGSLAWERVSAQLEAPTTPAESPDAGDSADDVAVGDADDVAASDTEAAS